jgi:hypothetical protein
LGSLNGKKIQENVNKKKEMGVRFRLDTWGV